jgi:hypothetical protein
MGNKNSTRQKSMETLEREFKTLDINTQCNNLSASSLNTNFARSDDILPSSFIVTDTGGNVVSNNTKWFSKPGVAKFLNENLSSNMTGSSSPANTSLKRIKRSAPPVTSDLSCGGGIVCFGVSPISWKIRTQNGMTVLNGTASFTYSGVATPPFISGSFPVHFKQIFAANGSINTPKHSGDLSFFKISFDNFAAFYPSAGLNSSGFNWGAPGIDTFVVLTISVVGIV